MKYITCYHCDGTGKEEWEEELDDGESTIWRRTTCPRCGGKGKIEDWSSDDDD